MEIPTPMEYNDDLLEEEVKKYKNMVYQISVHYFQSYSYRKEPHFGLNDIVQEGTIGLIKSIRNYSEKNGSKNIWYRNKIIHAIQDFFRNNDFLPRDIRVKKRQLIKSYDLYYAKYGRQPTREDLCDYMGISIDLYEKEYFALDEIFFVSLETEGNSIYGIDDVNLKFQIPDNSHEKVRETINTKQKLGMIQSALYCLYINDKVPLRNYNIFQKYYYENKTMREIGKEVGITESRASQIISMTIDKIKKILKIEEKFQHRKIRKRNINYMCNSDSVQVA